MARTPADSVPVRTSGPNPGTPSVFRRERRLRLARPGGFEGGVLLAPPGREQPPHPSGAARLQRTRLAVRGGEADPHHRPALVVVLGPARTAVPGRAGRDLPVPVEPEILDGE